MEILTKKQAEARKLHKYFTGRPCNKGHLTLRYSNTGACIACIATYARERREQAKRIWVRVELRHVDDAAVLHEFAAALNAAREYDNLCRHENRHPHDSIT